jgi:putative flippase GtrA
VPDANAPLPPRSHSAKLLAREGVGYIVVGLIQLVLDWGVFVLLTALGISVTTSNLTGRASGAILGFWLNATYTFRGSAEGELPRRWSNVVKFLVGWVVTSLLSTLMVGAVDHAVGLRWAWVAKPMIDGVLAVLGFALSKYWIFR